MSRRALTAAPRTQVLQLYWPDKILSSAENREAAEHSLIAIMTRIGYLLSVAAPPAVMDDVEGRAVMPAGDNETVRDPRRLPRLSSAPEFARDSTPDISVCGSSSTTPTRCTS